MALTAISPLDGRYATQVRSLAPYFSEEALIGREPRRCWILQEGRERGLLRFCGYDLQRQLPCQY